MGSLARGDSGQLVLSSGIRRIINKLIAVKTHQNAHYLLSPAGWCVRSHMFVCLSVML